MKITKSRQSNFIEQPRCRRVCTSWIVPLLLLWMMPLFGVQAGVVFTNLHSFQSFPNGASPNGLVQGGDGDFYGTTQSGGAYNAGTVFKISASGALTTLYSFNGGNDGANPYAGLVQGSDGYFYGTTEGGGTEGCGTVFQISTNGVLTTLHSFIGGNDGAAPQAGLVQGSDGYFYGTTGFEGWGISGTVFKISTNGALISLYSFPGFMDSANPYAGLVQGSDGYFYGTTLQGGANYSGTVFRISTNGALTTLYSFTGGNDGAYPEAGLVQGSDGYFYGTTSDHYGGGYSTTVFKISTNGALTTLYSFTRVNDGANPYAGLVQGGDGYFYGTTQWGGTNGAGTVFRISTDGTLTSLYSFTGGNDGREPQAGLVQGGGGNFYGTTYVGGTGDNGTVFQMSTNGALTSLYSFPRSGNEGAGPVAGLVQGSDGYFYGTTQGGGNTNLNGGYGYGTVFKISTNGALTSLYSFFNGSGIVPNGLVQGSDGYFYGTTEFNDASCDPSGCRSSGYGNVFQISTNGAYTSLYSFTGGNDGANPYAGLVQGSDGSFYGTTVNGGAGGAGTVFRLTIVPQPQLTIIPSGPYVILAWPTNYSGFTLQSTTSLGSSAVWATNSSPPVVIGGDNVVINAASGKQQFYRLSSPSPL